MEAKLCYCFGKREVRLDQLAFKSCVEPVLWISPRNAKGPIKMVLSLSRSQSTCSLALVVGSIIDFKFWHKMLWLIQTDCSILSCIITLNKLVDYVLARERDAIYCHVEWFFCHHLVMSWCGLWQKFLFPLINIQWSFTPHRIFKKSLVIYHLTLS